jgi:hypothetical protein
MPQVLINDNFPVFVLLKALENRFDRIYYFFKIDFAGKLIYLFLQPL